MANPNEKQRQKKESVFDQARRDAEKKLLETRLTERKEETDRRIDEQCDKYIEAVEKYGLDNPMTVMLGTLLDVVIPLQELANQMVTMSDMMNTLGSTLDLIDLSIDNIFNVFDEGTRYGALDRFKSRYKIAVFKGNLKRRMKKILISVQGMQHLSETLKKAMTNLAGKNAKMMRKAAEGKRSKSKKGTVSANGEPLSGLALQMVEARRAERREGSEPQSDFPKGDSGDSGRDAGNKTDGASTGDPGVDGLIP